MLEQAELSGIQEESARQLIRRLRNLIEKLPAEMRDLQAENQALRNEINHLKREQGKPKVKASKAWTGKASNHSSEKERKKTRVISRVRKPTLSYAVYRTLPNTPALAGGARENRLSVLDVLRNGHPRRFRLNQDALACLENVQLSQAGRETLPACCIETEMDQPKYQKHVNWTLLNLGKQQRQDITNAAAIAAYWVKSGWPVTQILLCDDAPQFRRRVQKWDVSITEDGAIPPLDELVTQAAQEIGLAHLCPAPGF